MAQEELSDNKLIMAKFSRLKVYQTIEETGIIPLFYHPDIETVQNVVAACYSGGIRVFELTNRNAFAHKVFGKLIRWADVNCPEMIIGIGSVVDAPTAALYIQMGANFIVGPLLNPEISKICNRRLIPYTPGCATTTEIGYAQELGTEIVKVFPGGSVGGPSFIKSIKGPMPWSKLMATGGVEPTKESITEWFKAGVTCVGIGSNLFPDAVINEGNWIKITEKCKECISIIREFKA